MKPNPAATTPSTSTPAVELQLPGLHNVVRITQGLFSGSQPQGNPGFDSLTRLDVHTIISVDGTKPDLRRAKARNMRYVHIPIRYDGVTSRQTIQLAKAVRNLPGSIYLHCHHGKHRGPAAAAVAAIALNRMNPTQARRFLEQAGTSPDYPGLFATVEQTGPIHPAVLNASPAALPEVAEVSGMVETMVELDHAFDNLRQVSAAGWQVPKHHPDLVPLAEAARIADLLRVLSKSSQVADRLDDFGEQLQRATKRAASLEAAVAAMNRADCQDHIQALSSTCKECHAKYRN